MRYLAFPPHVSGNAAVIVLSGYGYLEHLGMQIYPVATVQIDRIRVHLLKPVYREWKQTTAVFQISICRFVKSRKGVFPRDLKTCRVVHVIYPYPAVLVDYLVVNRDIEYGGAAVFNERFSRVKRPLIALEKLRAEHLPDVFKIIREKFSDVAAILRGAHVSGKHLLIAARAVPAKLRGGYAVLPLHEILGSGTGSECNARAAGLACRIDDRVVYS